MGDNSQKPEPEEELIAAIEAKLRANRDTIRRSKSYGRLLWRTNKDGKIDIELEVKL